MGSLKKTAIRESSIQAQVLATFGAIPWIRLFRQNAGKIHTIEGRWVQLYPAGAADLSGWIGKWDHFKVHSPGRRIEIETKAPKKGPNKQQRRWAETCRKMGPLYILARSVDDVWTALEEAGYDLD